jgi:hypothetical protein
VSSHCVQIASRLAWQLGQKYRHLQEKANRYSCAQASQRMRAKSCSRTPQPASGLGNWQLYAASEPLRIPTPDTFRDPPEAVLAFMAAHGVVLLIDVFHDDTDWCIAVLDRDLSP